MFLQSPEVLLLKVAPCPAMHAAVSASSMLLGQILPALPEVSCVMPPPFAQPVIDLSTNMHASLGLCIGFHIHISMLGSNIRAELFMGTILLCFQTMHMLC